MSAAAPAMLPRAAPARVLALGAWLKNAACLLDGRVVRWSPLHGDLATPEACRALEASARALLAAAGGPVDAVAHDLHPDFESTRLALALADALGVPAVPVQHHHAHVGVVQAEGGDASPVVGLALDGVGLGTDGSAWGGELLAVAGADWRRLGHLSPLALPGGDVAAREPWRMAAALLHALGRGDEIVARLGPAVGTARADGVRTMLERRLNCPMTTSAGRWFDAVAGLLGLSVRQAVEAEAAVALEQAATQWLRAHATEDDGGASFGAAAPDPLDLQPLAAELLALADAGESGRAAARFHLALADRLAAAAVAAARAVGTAVAALAGGCFCNRLLASRVATRLASAGLDVRVPRSVGPGDAGLALGQAWIAAHALAAGRVTRPADAAKEGAPCA